MVFALIGLRGLVLSVDNPARQAFVIEIVGAERVVNAVGLNSVLVHSARITGPAIAGVVIALWGVALCFALNALELRRDADRAARGWTPSTSPHPKRPERGGVRARPPLRRPHARAAGAAAADGASSARSASTSR